MTFRSHIDGAAYEMSPERSIEIQGLLDSDIQMQLDECVALPAKDQGDRARDGTVAALGRALQDGVRRPAGQGDVRHRPGRRHSRHCAMRSAQALKAMDLKGYAIGGLAVGEPQAVMLDMLDITCPELPAEKPRYLMGVGTPDDILKSVARGIDMFDCVMPTARRPPRPRLYAARQGQSAQRPPCRRSAPARRGERLPGRARLFPRLSAPSGEVAARRSAPCC